MKILRYLSLLFVMAFAGMSSYSQDFNQNFINGALAVENGNFSDAMRYFKQGAMEGDKYSCGRLAALYFYGLGTDTNYDEARKWAKKGYDLGNSYSAAIYGLCYLYEKGLESAEGRKLARPALIYAYEADDAEFDNAELYGNAGVLVGVSYMDEEDFDEALVWLKRTINDFPTYVPALGRISQNYWYLKDYDTAASFASLADEQEDLVGTLVLGLCQAYGNGIEKDEEAGLDKIKIVAAVGIPAESMYELGKCYYYGIGTPVNKELAEEWFEKAAKAGIPEAEEMLEKFNDSTSVSSNPGNSVNIGHIGGAGNSGSAGHTGGIVNPERYSDVDISNYGMTPAEIGELGRRAFSQGRYQEAKDYLLKAANKKDPEACGYLGMGYMYGAFDEGQDLNKAMKWAQTGYYNSMPNPNGLCTGVMGIIGTTLAENKKQWLENLDYLEYAYDNGFPSSSIGNLISVSYLLKGDEKKAEDWARKIMALEETEEDKDDYYMASAILGKIQMDHKDYMNASVTVRNAASEGGNPLAEYVMGKCQIKMDIFPEVGQERVKAAATYDYYPAIDIKVFDDEIQKYYKSVKDKEF